MTETALDTADIVRISRDTDAGSLGHAVYADLSALLESLPDEAWQADTDCTGWTVGHIVRHIVGAAKSHISTREMLRQMALGRRSRSNFGGSALDATNDLQIRDHEDLTPEQLKVAVKELGPAAVDARMAKPGLIRMVSVPNPIAGNMPSGVDTRLRLGHLFDTVLTRDIWMHRIDIARAAGVEPAWGPTDRRVLEDIVAEWLAMQDGPLELVLTGSVPGHFRSGTGGDRIELESIELTRILAGRGSHDHPAFTRKVLF